MFLAIFFLLLCGHALADYALQSDAMAKGKNRHTPIDPSKVPPGQTPQVCWFYWLTAHALIHGLTVALLLLLALPHTEAAAWSPGLAFRLAATAGILEAISHSWIDLVKCEGLTSIHQDQLLHILCKLAICLPLL
jgi:Protein of unknown function (DUF3307)